MHLDLRHLTLLAALILAPACGSDGDDNADDNSDDSTDDGGVTCAAQATITNDAIAKTVTGVGTVTCDGDAIIDLEVCVQWDASGAFEDTVCRTNGQSGVASLTFENTASCGLSSGRSFRTRLNASIDGVALAEVLSDDVICF